MKEIWKDIKGYEGIYQVSNMGKVKSLKRTINNSTTYGGKATIKERILKPKKDKDGYEAVGLNKDGKRKDFRVHRLVADAFIPNPNNYPIVNHKDEVKDNNVVSNLEWCTVRYNNTYGTTCERRVASNMYGKKFCKKIRCTTTDEVFDSIKEASEHYGFSRSNFSHAMKKNKPCGKLADGTPLYWEYVS